MDEYNEYLKYIKSITDKFISSLTYNSAQPIEEYYTPDYKIKDDDIIFTGYSVDENSNLFFVIDKSPPSYGEAIRTPKKVVEAWKKIQNEYAVKWLNKNTITYEDWLKKNLNNE